MSQQDHIDFNPRESEAYESRYGADPNKEAVINAKQMSASEGLMALRPQLLNAKKIVHVNLDDKDVYLPEDKDWKRGADLASEIIFWVLLKIKNGEDQETLAVTTDYGWKIAVNAGRYVEVHNA